MLLVLKMNKLKKCLSLFGTFFRIGAFTIGGGYAMLPLIQREVAEKRKWIDESVMLDIVAIAESTPGPIAVNLATFIGSTQGGFLGALVATLGIVLPSFVIILIIAAFVRNLMKYEVTKAILEAIRPTVVGMIFAVLLTMSALVLLGTKTIGTPLAPDYIGIALFLALLLLSFLYKKLLKKPPSPILIILLSAAVGMLVY